jgi:hypothetical protein
MKTGQAEMKATVSAILQEMKSWQEEMKACTEKRDAIPEEGSVIVEHQKVLNEEAAVETTGALEDRSGDQLLIMGYKNPQKRWIKGNLI